MKSSTDRKVYVFDSMTARTVHTLAGHTHLIVRYYFNQVVYNTITQILKLYSIDVRFFLVVILEWRTA
jgi:hypothetical protein